MKLIIAFILLLTMLCTSFSQVVNPRPTLTQSDYLKKSKKQNTAAWIVLGGGFALTSAGIITGINGVTNEIFGVFNGEKSNTIEVGTVLFYSGLAAMVASIPLFMASSKNKKRAMGLAIKIEEAKQFNNQYFVSRPVPSLTLKINL